MQVPVQSLHRKAKGGLPLDKTNSDPAQEPSVPCTKTRLSRASHVLRGLRLPRIRLLATRLMFLWDDHRGAYHNSPTTQRSQLECGRAQMLPGRTPQQYRFLATAERHRKVLRSTRVLQDLLTCNCGTKLADPGMGSWLSFSRPRARIQSMFMYS